MEIRRCVIDRIMDNDNNRWNNRDNQKYKWW